jgi:acyl-CoA oxidase
MDSTIREPSKAPADSTDRIFQTYLGEKAQRLPKDIISGGIINNEAIVEAFQWRAADLVRLTRCIRKLSFTESLLYRAIKHIMRELFKGKNGTVY